MDRITFFVQEEQVDTQKGICEITGWAVGPVPLKVQVLDWEKKPLEAVIVREARSDVVRQFPGEKVELKCGFTVKITGLKGSGCRIVFSGKGYRAEYPVYYNATRNCIKKTGVYLEKGWGYLKSGKVRSLAVKIYKKASGMDGSYREYAKWMKRHSADERELKRQRNYAFPQRPLISIVIPLYNTPLNYLEELLQSVIGQSYENWELCLADGSEHRKIQRYLEKKYSQEQRIRYQHLNENGGISANTNRALELATGEYFMLCDHDDVLEKDALFHIVQAINSKEKPEIVYTDEDKVTMEGDRYFDPHFKPDFNLDLLRSNNYICHIFVVSRAVVEKAGIFRSEYDGAQDYDFILRCCENAQHIVHIPRALYHWRSHPNSTAGNPASKMYAYENGRRAVEAHYQRLGIDARVEMTEDWGRYRSIWKVKGEPLVSILIPNKDHLSDLKRCVDSIYQKSTYRNFEILILENNSTNQETFRYYQELESTYENLRVLRWEKGFNYAAINNFGAEQAKGEYLLFLNNDTQVITPNWLEELLGYCQREDVGVVGAKLYYPNNTIQHAGIVLGMGADGVAGHILYGTERGRFTYAGRANSTQDISAVTAACMMVKKDIHRKIKGFDTEFAVAFNDVDYCLRVREIGKLVVFHAFVELYHYESNSRGKEDTREKQKRLQQEAERFRKRWRSVLEKGDPYYNPNLSLLLCDCSLRWPRRINL